MIADKKLIEKVGTYIAQHFILEYEDCGTSQEKSPASYDIANFLNEWSNDSPDICREVPAYHKSDRIPGTKFNTDDNESGGRALQTAANRKIDELISHMEETFSQKLLRMIDEKGMSDVQAYTKAGIDRRHFSKIRKDVYYSPNKKTVLAFAIALELSLDEAVELLRSAGFALSRSSKTDIIVAYFLQNQIYDMFTINEVLYAYGQPVF